MLLTITAREVVSATENAEWTLVLAEGVVDVTVTAARPADANVVEQLLVAVPTVAAPSSRDRSVPPTEVIPVAVTVPSVPVQVAPASLYATKVASPLIELVLAMNTWRVLVEPSGTYCIVAVVPFWVQAPADRVPLAPVNVAEPFSIE